VPIEPLIAAKRVRARIAELAAEIARDYAGRALTLISIAEGARRFTEALAGELRGRGIDPACTEVRVQRSRGQRLETPRIAGFALGPLAGRDVLVVDDIADEGATLRAVLELAASAAPRSLRSAVLVDKRERRRHALALDYVGFEIASGWVVGFGMDLDGAHRELDWIGVVREGGADPSRL
jgi:hypoxanthine phosphoribosyltransferase